MACKTVSDLSGASTKFSVLGSDWSSDDIVCRTEEEGMLVIPLSATVRVADAWDIFHELTQKNHESADMKYLYIICVRNCYGRYAKILRGYTQLECIAMGEPLRQACSSDYCCLSDQPIIAGVGIRPLNSTDDQRDKGVKTIIYG